MNFLGEDVTVLVGGSQTDEKYTLVRVMLKEGYGPPRHVHHAEDELFYLQSGQMLAKCAGQRVTVDAGGCLFLPCGSPHAFVITKGSVDMIQITNPAASRGSWPRSVRCPSPASPTWTT